MSVFKRSSHLLQFTIRAVKRIPIVGRLARVMVARSPSLQSHLAEFAALMHLRGMEREGVDDLSPQSRLIYTDLKSAIGCKEAHADLD